MAERSAPALEEGLAALLDWLVLAVEVMAMAMISVRVWVSGENWREGSGNGARCCKPHGKEAPGLR
ncbi:hypothetical protein [Synechococcus sp. WH 8101]|uniref:hypothetical protein n=1 Tax=Synechococcus sp. WH 8101 TaxID=59932 RepID=UPI0010238D0E|nr:hypothetical protein [Synechococcus sp. WH 8101]